MNTRFAIVALMSAAVAGIAAADTIQMRYTGGGKGSVVRIYHPTATMNVFAGQMNQSLINPVGPQAQAIAGNHVTFCGDVAQYVTREYQDFTLTDIANIPNNTPVGADRAAAIRDIFNYAGINILTAEATNNAATAFQLAIWEVMHDYNPLSGLSSISLASGNFRSTKTDGSALGSGIMAQFNAFIGSIGAESANRMSLVGLTHPGSQDQILAMAIPAPGSAALAGLGTLCLAARRRRTA